MVTYESSASINLKVYGIFSGERWTKEISEKGELFKLYFKEKVLYIFKYFLYFLFFCHFHSLCGALYRVDHGILLVVKATLHDFFDTIEGILIEFELASLYYSLLHVMDNLDGSVFK